MKKTFASLFKTFAAVLCISLLLTTTACSSSSADYPDTLDSYVYDGVGVLSDETIEHINSVGYNLSQKTGGEIVVACVSTTGYTDIADYAYEMFNQWKIGGSEENNGVLLLLSIDEDDYWCLQGEGLEKTLSSGQIKLILSDYLEPYFAEKNYNDGVLATFDALVDKFEAAYSVTITDDSQSGGIVSEADDDFFFDDDYDYYFDYTFGDIMGDIIFMAIIIFIIAMIVLVAIIPPRRRRRRGIFDPPPPRHHHAPPPPRGGMFGPHHPHNGGFSGGHRPSGMGSSRPMGGSRPGGMGGSRPGGGMSRGGGAGRR